MLFYCATITLTRDIEPVSGFEPETHGLKAKTTAVRFLCGKPYTLLYLAELHRLIYRIRKRNTLRLSNSLHLPSSNYYVAPSHLRKTDFVNYPWHSI